MCPCDSFSLQQYSCSSSTACAADPDTLEQFVMSTFTESLVFLSLQTTLSVGCDPDAFVNKAPFSGYLYVGGIVHPIAFIGDILVTGLIPGQCFPVKAYCV